MILRATEYTIEEIFLPDLIHIDGGYPVDNFENVTELLKAAQHNEMEEFEDV